MKGVGLVLDTSAVARYPSIAVGEVLTQVEENGFAFTVPMACLAAAARDQRPVDLLLAHAAFQPVDVPYDQWRQYAAMRDVLGRDDCAAAYLIALVHSAFLLTARPDWYAVLGDDEHLITF